MKPVDHQLGAQLAVFRPGTAKLWHPMHMQTSTHSCAPIGVYDSGIGGVSVLKALRARHPHESFIYVADSAHAPYGDMDASFVEARAIEVVRFLVQCRAKAVVIACNTASVVAASKLRSLYSLPIVAMEPAIKPAAELTRSKVVLVLATSRTVQSASVARLCQLYGSSVRIILQPCPGLVEHVERGALDKAAIASLLEAYLRPALDAGADTLVLGCTHYAFLEAQIREIAGPQVSILEPSQAVAKELDRRLSAAGLTGSLTTDPAVKFFTSGPIEAMGSFLDAVWGSHANVGSLPRSANYLPVTEKKPSRAG